VLSPKAKPAPPP
jgi:hypothetical protein